MLGNPEVILIEATPPPQLHKPANPAPSPGPSPGPFYQALPGRLNRRVIGPTPSPGPTTQRSADPTAESWAEPGEEVGQDALMGLFVDQLPPHIRPHVLDMRDGNRTGNCGYSAVGIAANWANPILYNPVRSSMRSVLTKNKDLQRYLDIKNRLHLLVSSSPLETSWRDTDDVLNTRRAVITDVGQYFQPFILGALAATTYHKPLIYFDCVEPGSSRTFVPIKTNDVPNLNPANCMVIARVDWDGCHHFVALRMDAGIYRIPKLWDKYPSWVEAWNEQVGS